MTAAVSFLLKDDLTSLILNTLAASVLLLLLTEIWNDE
ncbi:MAG: hypothetical protein K0S56_1091 [Microvirga sp.]|jgi:hypothetical protein|nr:hypothetical protein [Microvirga sp.]